MIIMLFCVSHIPSTQFVTFRQHRLWIIAMRMIPDSNHATGHGGRAYGPASCETTCSSVAGLLCSTAKAHDDANDLASQAPCTTSTILMPSFQLVCKSSFVLTFSFRIQVSFSCPTPPSMHHTLCSNLVFACIGACPLRKLLATMPGFVQSVPEP